MSYRSKHVVCVKWRSSRVGIGAGLVAVVVNALLAGFPALAVEPSAASGLYVAVDGNDQWSGTLAAPNAQGTDGPVATLTCARNVLRSLRAKGPLTPGFAVNVREGRYYLQEPLVLTAKDSGTLEQPTVFQAVPGEHPVLSGGRVLTNWKPYQGKILKCELRPDAKHGRWKFRTLYANGRRLTRARFPNLNPQEPTNEPWLTVERIDDEHPTERFCYSEKTFPRSWAKPHLGEVFLETTARNGGASMIPIQAIDQGRRLLSMAHGYRDFSIFQWDKGDWTIQPAPAKVGYGLLAGATFWIENLVEEIDQPGEWCLDWEEGVVYLWPPDDVDVYKGQVVAPALHRLIDLQGCSFVNLSGFTLTETHAGDTSHPAGLDGLDWHSPDLQQDWPWGYCGEAIRLGGASRCTIENNRIMAIGGNGIYLLRRNDWNTVRYNEVSEAGANGIVLAGTRTVNGVLGEQQEHPTRNQITDNHIHHIGVFDWSAAGVLLGRSEANVIGHNEIHDVPHNTIALGADGYGRNIVEYNRLHRCCQRSKDNGVINCWMATPIESRRIGHVIRYNFCYDSPRADHGVYLDNGAWSCLVQGNIIVGVNKKGVCCRARDNFVENNIFVNCREGGVLLLFDNWSLLGNWAPAACNRFCKNIVVVSDPNQFLLITHPLAHPIERGFAECNDNVYFNMTGGPCNVENEQGAREPWEKWCKRTGFDANSVIADPLFVDLAHNDFRLKPESPALRLGFQPIDVGKIGIRPIRPKEVRP